LEGYFFTQAHILKLRHWIWALALNTVADLGGGGAWELKHPPFHVFLLKINNNSQSGKFLATLHRGVANTGWRPRTNCT